MHKPRTSIISVAAMLMSTLCFAQQTGDIDPYIISLRYATNAAGYFATERLLPARTFYETYDSVYNTSPAVDSLENLLSYDAGSNSGRIYVPTNYDANRPAGLLLYIPGGTRTKAVGRYISAFESDYIIGACALYVSNNDPEIQRISHTLDLMTTIMETYNIDTNRIYLAGSSGGVLPTTLLTFMYPELFSGMICNVRSLTFSEHDYFTAQETIDIVERYKHRWSYVTGPDDFNYSHVLSYVPLWRERGVPARLFDDPNMGHGAAPLELFWKALKWIDYKHHINNVQSYSEWQHFQFDERNQTNFNPDADFDMDGSLNRDEYIFNSNPLDPLSSPDANLMITSTNNEIRFSYDRRAVLNDYTITVGVASNLTENWDYTESGITSRGQAALPSGKLRNFFSPSHPQSEHTGFFNIRLY